MIPSKKWRLFAITGILAVYTLPFLLSAQTNSANVREFKDKIQNIERSIKVTRAKIGAQSNTKFTPDLLFMLAELYYDKAIISGALQQALNPNSENPDTTLEQQLFSEASEQYRIIEERYPDYPKLDRVLFNRANVLKLMGNETEALKSYKAVTERFKDSKYRDASLLEIGNIFFIKKDYEYCLKTLSQIGSTSDFVLFLKAQLKIGQTLTLMEKWSDALDAYEVIYDNQKENSAEIRNLQEEALIASVLPLVELSLNKALIKNNRKNPIQYYLTKSLPNGIKARALQRLAARYEIKKQDLLSANAYWELFHLQTSPSEKKAAFESAYLKYKKLKQESYPPYAISDLLSLILKMHSSLEGETLLADVPKYEPVIRDLITSQHKLVMATKRSDELLNLASHYEQYLVLYPSASELPLMTLNLAELYFHSNIYHLAGKYYLQSLSGKSHSKVSNREVLSAALEAHLLGASDLKSPSFELLLNQTGYKLAASQFIKKFPSDSKVADIHFNIAKITYDEQNFNKASQYLIRWLQKFPKHPQARNAALLYLDCFYLRNQLKELSKAANKLQAISGLDSDIKNQAKTASQQTQLRAIRSISGEFGSKDYAVKFAQFARKNKNSKLGEQALYEAFASLRALNSAEAFDIGEEYVATYPNTPRGKEVFLSLTQIALARYDYLKAASYLAAFGQKYEEDPNSIAFLQQAANIFELFGKTTEAVTSYKLAKTPDKAVLFLVKQKQWKLAATEAAKLSGIRGNYFQGLSLYRLGDTSSGVRLLNQVVTSAAANADEKAFIGHAAVILLESQMALFNRTSKEAFSPQILQNKTMEYQNISQLADKAIQSQGGKWVIAGLYNLALLNKNMAQFLDSAKPPKAMSPAQLKTLLQPQVASYNKASQETQKQCQSVANQAEIFSGYTLACQTLSLISEKSEAPEVFLNFNQTLDTKLLGILAKTPKDEKAIIAAASGLIKNQNLPTAHLILMSALEFLPNSSDIYALLGITSLHFRDIEASQSYFRKSLELSGGNPVANRGLAGIANHFKASNVAKKYKQRAPASNSSNLHPWLRF